jgi:precorrin-6B methylase 2
MALEYQSQFLEGYRIDYYQPHEILEPFRRETEIVNGALRFLVKNNILADAEYSSTKYLAHRQAVESIFCIPWTAISPRARHFVYAVNAIHRPLRMVAAGIHCGNTFISNAGAAVGPGKCYDAIQLVGIELRPDLAELADRNVRNLDPGTATNIVGGDAVRYLSEMKDTIDLLYIDVEDNETRDKSLYYEVVTAAFPKLRPRGLVLAHNSVNHAAELVDFLQFVRDGIRFQESVNVILDNQGMEVSIKAGPTAQVS